MPRNVAVALCRTSHRAARGTRDRTGGDLAAGALSSLSSELNHAETLKLLEPVLLRHLGHTGRISNRLAINDWAGQTVPVPWTTNCYRRQHDLRLGTKTWRQIGPPRVAVQAAGLNGRSTE